MRFNKQKLILTKKHIDVLETLGVTRVIKNDINTIMYINEQTILFKNKDNEYHELLNITDLLSFYLSNNI